MTSESALGLFRGLAALRLWLMGYLRLIDILPGMLPCHGDS
jgi:hypothetical protein